MWLFTSTHTYKIYIKIHSFQEEPEPLSRIPAALVPVELLIPIGYPWGVTCDGEKVLVHHFHRWFSRKKSLVHLDSTWFTLVRHFDGASFLVVSFSWEPWWLILQHDQPRYFKSCCEPGRNYMISSRRRRMGRHCGHVLCYKQWSMTDWGLDLPRTGDYSG